MRFEKYNPNPLELDTGRKVDVVIGSETKDTKSDITYVHITGAFNGWITASALEK